MRHSKFLAAFALLAAVPCARAETLLAETAEDAVFDIRPCSGSYTVDSLASPLVLRYCTGDTITLTAPDAMIATPVSDAAAYGGHSWIPASGGVWTAVNSNEGEVSFRVRYSLFGLDGTGSEDNPARVVDAEDFAATLALADELQGFVFTAEDGDAGAFPLPDGFGTVALGNGSYRLVSASDGFLSEGTPAALALDTELPGPDRRVRTGTAVPGVAYSGDDWIRTNLSAACTLTFRAPSGTEKVSEFTGAGLFSHEFDETGVWTVTLVGDDGSTRVARINLLKAGMFFTVR